MNKSITRSEIKHRMDNDLTMTIIEALPPKYYETGHLPGAINIPHDEVSNMAESMLPDKESFIVVYCANSPCPNSRVAANTLTRMGYRNVYEYVEGKQDWIEAGFAVETAEARRVG